ncbi:thyroid transcription factor 1-associated protein 26 [Leptodactylus fuscus]|uniref:thyroid transcription factor 1-associated protein 26 n=1 Tax=Leptodactylus fuscus TaxID=238119 RepID=UPI003F4E9830
MVEVRRSGNMAATRAPSVSLQHRKRHLDVGSRGGAVPAGGGRFTKKGGHEAPGDKRGVTSEPGATGSRGPGKRVATEGRVKRKWRPDPNQKVFEGSAKEGQGFALWRKRKVQLEYKKLQRKQKKANTKEGLYSDHYPEHLKHLYLAEEEKLKSQEKQRKPKIEAPEPGSEEEVVIPKKKIKKTSNQKAKEEYERVQRERARKREEAENNRRKREEAQKLYRQKKMEAFKAISSKTKKGQPNFNVQMEYLLKKIEGTS